MNAYFSENNTSLILAQFIVVQISGKQELICPGTFCDVTFLRKALTDSVLSFTRILFYSKKDKILIGTPLLKINPFSALVLQHLFSKKLCIFRYKRKKNYKKFNTYKQKKTRIFVFNNYGT